MKKKSKTKICIFKYLEKKSKFSNTLEVASWILKWCNVHLQMGSTMKKSIFDEQTSKALKNWRMAVKKTGGKSVGKSPTKTLGGSTNGSTIHSSGPTLHRFKTTGHSRRSSSTYEDRDESDLEADPLSPSISLTTNLDVRVDHHGEENRDQGFVGGGSDDDGGDFSFVKLDPIQRTST